MVYVMALTLLAPYPWSYFLMPAIIASTFLRFAPDLYNTILYLLPVCSWDLQVYGIIMIVIIIVGYEHSIGIWAWLRRGAGGSDGWWGPPAQVGPAPVEALPAEPSSPTGLEPGCLVRDFLEGGSGGEPLERTPPNSAGRANVSCPSPPPRAVRGSAFYTEPQDPPSPGILLQIARALWAGPWAILARLGMPPLTPPRGAPPRRVHGWPLTPAANAAGNALWHGSRRC